MAIKEISKNGLSGYLVSVVAKGRYDKELRKTLQRELIGAKKTEAVVVERNLRDQARKIIESQETSGLTFGRVLAKWVKCELMIKQQETFTMQDYHATIIQHAKKILRKPITELCSADILDIYDEMKNKGLSRSRLRSLRSGINVVYEWAHNSRVVPRNIESPAKSAIIPIEKSCSRKEELVLSPSDLKKFLIAARDADHRFFYVWALAANTGMRSGELYALRWTDIDFQTKMIAVRGSFNKRKNGIKSPKNGENRLVPMAETTESLLKELKLKTGSTEFVCPRILDWKNGKAAEITRGFCSTIGVPEINFHALRSCFAVNCLSKGISVPIVMKIGGWHDIKAFQHYIRLSGVELHNALDGIDMGGRYNMGAKVLSIESGLIRT